MVAVVWLMILVALAWAALYAAVFIGPVIKEMYFDPPPPLTKATPEEARLLESVAVEGEKRAAEAGVGEAGGEAGGSGYPSLEHESSLSINVEESLDDSAEVAPAGDIGRAALDQP